MITSPFVYIVKWYASYGLDTGVVGVYSCRHSADKAVEKYNLNSSDVESNYARKEKHILNP